MRSPSPVESTVSVSGETPSGGLATDRGVGTSVGSTIDPYTEGYVTLARVGHMTAIVRAARELNQFAFDHGYCRFCDADEPTHAPDCLGDLADAIADLDALDTTGAQ